MVLQRLLSHNRGMKDSTRKKALILWVQNILDESGLSATELAKRATIATSTITRMFEPDWSGRMRDTTIKAIAEAANTRPPGAVLPEPKGFEDSKAEAYVAPDALAASSPTMQSLSGKDGAAVTMLILQSDSLTGAGLLPGDRLIVDLNKTPRAGDVVVAQSYDWRHGTAETIVRIYEPPYLISHSLAPRPQKPLMVDNDAIIIKGVVIHQARDLAGAA